MTEQEIERYHFIRSAGHRDAPDVCSVLPEDAAARKAAPIFSGVLAYFPLALAAVARVSKRGNDQHNPGQPLHWSRGKSTDHEDCVVRHLIDVETADPETGEYRHAEALAWRALAKLQELEEKRLGKPMSRGSRIGVSSPELTEQALDFTYGNLAASTNHKPQKEAFKKLALERGWSAARFETWSIGREWIDK